MLYKFVCKYIFVCKCIEKRPGRINTKLLTVVTYGRGWIGLVAEE